MKIKDDGTSKDATGSSADQLSEESGPEPHISMQQTERRLWKPFEDIRLQFLSFDLIFFHFRTNFAECHCRVNTNRILNLLFNSK